MATCGCNRRYNEPCREAQRLYRLHLVAFRAAGHDWNTYGGDEMKAYLLHRQAAGSVFPYLRPEVAAIMAGAALEA
ncbi:hypothetical protein LCGC14_0789880 [marine sediment metagenome]|uniref:Uncharacterized protein n=1 Tax=marine sediment metagenome TaxID=412755 RepID=A0A0F9T009_9ZZZZ